jgi:hypothetical protein
MYQLPDVLQPELILAPEGDVNLFPAGWVVRLFTNNLTPNKANVVTDFTELTNVQVPGYLPVAGAWKGTPIRKPDGSWEDQGAAPLEFKATGLPPAPQTVYGWFATNAAGTVLLGSGVFAAPFVFTLLGDGFTLEQVINVLQLTGNTYQFLIDMEQE